MNDPGGIRFVARLVILWAISAMALLLIMHYAGELVASLFVVPGFFVFWTLVFRWADDAA